MKRHQAATIHSNVHALLTELKSCSIRRDLQWGRRIHAKEVQSLNNSNAYVVTATIRMYAKCGSMVEARQLFDSVQKHDVVSWTSLILGYADNGQGDVALALFSRMKRCGLVPDCITYVAAFKACASLAVTGQKEACLERGREMHSEIGCDLNLSMQNTLIDMYSKCCSMVEARRVFDSIPHPDVVSWNALLLGYAENGEGHVALDLFCRMNAAGESTPNSGTYVAALKACISLALAGREDCLNRGRAVHLGIACPLDHRLQSTLIDMYAKCGSMVDARRVFDMTKKPSVVSWNVLLLGYAENGEGQVALDLFSRMKAHGVASDAITYVAALKACTSLTMLEDRQGDCLEFGRKIHSEIGSHLDHYLQNLLIDMYAKCGSMVDAQSVFQSIKTPDVVSWTALLSGYAENGEAPIALELFVRMKERGCAPNSVTYIAALKACATLAAVGEKGDCLELGRRVHRELGCHLNQSVQNTLVDMYAKCGSMSEARCVFDNIQKPDVVSWTALLLGYAENGEGNAALDLFSKMKELRCAPNSVTYIAVLKACTSLAMNGDRRRCLERGKEMHSEIGCHMNHYVQNTLMDMYAKCGSMVEARCVFESMEKPNVVSWNALLLAYAENGESHVVLALFSKMKELGYAPNSLTYIASFRACAGLAASGDADEKKDGLERGRELHLEIGHQPEHHVSNALVDMYAKCSSMNDARQVFENMRKPDAVSWNALLLGYVENGEAATVLGLFSRMKAGCEPTSVTYIAVLKACALMGDVALGRKVHSGIQEFTSQVVACLTGFYAKCGSMAEACEVFDSHPEARDTPTWNALLAGHAASANTASVFGLFERMKDAGFRPDGVTFLSMLLCCSHAGLVEKARMYFEAMQVEHGVAPTVMHYTCMVDALGRANQLNAAIALMRRMPCKLHAVTWRTLLGSCHRWKNVELAKMVFQSLVGLDQSDAPSHVLMAHIYSGNDSCVKLSNRANKQTDVPATVLSVEVGGFG